MVSVQINKVSVPANGLAKRGCYHSLLILEHQVSYSSMQYLDYRQRQNELSSLRLAPHMWNSVSVQRHRSNQM